MIEKNIIEQLREKYNKSFKVNTEEVIDDFSKSNMDDIVKLKVINNSGNGISKAMQTHLENTNAVSDLINTRNEASYLLFGEDIENFAIKRVLKEVLCEYAKTYDLNSMDDLTLLHEDLIGRIVDMNAKILLRTIELSNVEKLMSMMDKQY